MDAGTWVALIAALLATVIAVVVPIMTFRFALQQDHVRWMREQRSELYVDLLTEARTRQLWLEIQTAPEAARESLLKDYTDTRLPPMENARLAARGTIFGSRAVNKSFIQAGEEWSRLLQASRHGNDPDATQMLVRVRLGRLILELTEAIRRELGADRVPLDSASAPSFTIGEGRNAGLGKTPPFLGEDEAAAAP
jgi:hypothetical protein